MLGIVFCVLPAEGCYHLPREEAKHHGQLIAQSRKLWILNPSGANGMSLSKLPKLRGLWPENTYTIQL